MTDGPRRVVTLRDVSEASGVSVMTVSNVINGKKNVRETTRARVEKSIKKLGYVPTQAARSLRTNRQSAIGLLFIDDSRTYLADPFIAEIIAGLAKELTAHHHSLVVELGHSRELGDLTAFRKRSVDALIIIASGGGTFLNALIRKTDGLNLPRILVQGNAEARDVLLVNQDDFDGGMQIADHLAARDVKTVLIVETELIWHAFEQRKKGLIEGLHRTGRGVVTKTLKSSAESFDAASRAFSEYLDGHELPDAVVGLNDYLALSVLSVLRQRKIEVPRDVLLSGFNAAEILHFVSPALTTVRSVAGDLGRLAASTALAAIEGRSTPPSLLPVALVRGETT